MSPLSSISWLDIRDGVVGVSDRHHGVVVELPRQVTRAAPPGVPSG
ncbi:hypothetical protein ACBJ59_13945 [Nonomuraea sp. MTCD27]